MRIANHPEEWSEDQVATARRDRENASSRLRGTDAFRLYETFGLPLDFMVDACS